MTYSFTLNLSEAVSIASFANVVGGKGEHVELLKAIHLNFTAGQGESGSLVVTATDRHVAVRQTLEVWCDTSFAINLGAGIQKFLKGVKYDVTLEVDGSSITATSGGSTFTESLVEGAYPMESLEPMFESATESMLPVPSLNLDLGLLVKVAKLVPVSPNKDKAVYGVYTQGERDTASKLPMPVLLVRDGLRVLVMPVMNR